jgi:hypothetical protein
MEAEIAAMINELEALAPGYKDLFKDRPCSFSFPEIDLDPKELLKFDLLCSLYKHVLSLEDRIADRMTAEINRILFPNPMQRLVLLCCRPMLTLSLPKGQYAVFRKTPDDFLAATDRYSAKRLRKILRFFGPLPPAPKAAQWGQSDHLEENLDYLLAKHGRLAFWGLGDYFRLYISSPLCDRPGVFLVDRVNRDSFGQKQGQSPDVLKTKNVGLIIISAAPDSDPYRAISRDVAAEYPDAAVMPLEHLLRYRLAEP